MPYQIEQFKNIKPGEYLFALPHDLQVVSVEETESGWQVVILKAGVLCVNEVPRNQSALVSLPRIKRPFLMLAHMAGNGEPLHILRDRAAVAENDNFWTRYTTKPLRSFSQDLFQQKRVDDIETSFVDYLKRFEKQIVERAQRKNPFAVPEPYDPYAPHFVQSWSSPPLFQPDPHPTFKGLEELIHTGYADVKRHGVRAIEYEGRLYTLMDDGSVVVTEAPGREGTNV